MQALGAEGVSEFFLSSALQGSEGDLVEQERNPTPLQAGLLPGLSGPVSLVPSGSTDARPGIVDGCS